MGIFSGIKAIWDIQRLSKGGTAKLSLAQITSVIINLPDARKNLKRDEFEQVYALYKSLQKCKSKIPMGLDGYYDISARLILMFDQLAPYQLYGGRSEIESEFLLNEVRRLYKDDPNFAAGIVGEIKRANASGETISDNKKWRKSRLIYRTSLGVLLVAFLVAVYIAIYNRDMTGEFYDAGYQAGYQDGVASVQVQGSRPAAETTSGWVYVTGAGEKYHRKDCRYVTDNSKMLSVEKAISRGYEPCSVCEPPKGLS